jgi:hypothetical protein
MKEKVSVAVERTDGRRMVIELRSPHGKRSVFRVSDS